MHGFDLTPLFRSTIGFDRLSDMIDTAFKLEESRAPSYPPYNIEKLDENEYQITMAVAGFQQKDLTVTAQENTLTVSGQIGERTEQSEVNYLYKGIATRSFERKFQLADHVKVTDAQLADGLLTLKLVREVPEASKPRTIAITNSNKTIEGKKAA